MPRELKVYVVQVRDGTNQSLRIMDVNGYSHCSRPFHSYPNGVCRYAYIRGTNKKNISREVEKKLGDAYQPNLNFVELYEPGYHAKRVR